MKDNLQNISDLIGALAEDIEEIKKILAAKDASDKDEAVGAQGVPLTPGRSIAVDKALHVYGTPFFVEGELPIETEISKTPFRRLMVAQDTGSAIVGPARADLYFGAGTEMAFFCHEIS